MDRQPDARARRDAVVVVDAEVPERGWLSVQLGWHSPVHAGFAEPRAAWAGPGEGCLRGQTQFDGVQAYGPPPRPVFEQPDPLTAARLRAWVGRLRGEAVPPAAEPVAEGLAQVASAPAAARKIEKPRLERGIPASALVTVRRAAAREAPPPSDPPKPLPRPDVEVRRFAPRAHLRLVPSSPGVRFVLLCLAAFFLTAGLVHSVARWKPSRVIVVPATPDGRSVVT